MLHPTPIERGGTETPIERGGTEVHTPESRSPTVRRRELGALLKQLRTQRGWTAEQVGGWLRFSPSKMSRLETGHRGANARDINDLCDLYGVDDEQRRRLLELASEGKQRAWWQPLGLPYSTYVGLESEAVSISDFPLGFIPGLLQTADYAHANVRAVLPDMAHGHGRAARTRANGQAAASQSGNAPTSSGYRLLALHRVVGSRAVMRAQLERLLERSDGLKLRCAQSPSRQVPCPPGTSSSSLRFASAEVKDVVFIEGLTGDAIWKHR